MYKKIILRSEYKASERRTPLTPNDAKKLLEKGIVVDVESSKNRIYSDKDYEDVGCKIISEHAWEKVQDQNLLILGLKELPLSFEKIHGKHMYFAHIFKGQTDAPKVFKQYEKGEGTLYDLEFLQDENKRRVAAFGYWAGFVGGTLALKHYLEKNSNRDWSLNSFDSIDDMKKELFEEFNEIEKIKVLIIGARGRCGKGAVDALSAFGVELTKWDRKETTGKSQFPEILEHELFINCVYLQSKIPPFISKENYGDDAKLKVVSDVSCDPNSPWNPIPIYNELTSWDRPYRETNIKGLDIVAIDNLPSALPKESSDDFSSQLLPTLLNQIENKHIWQTSLDYFERIKDEIL
ncbi:MAG: saccharopine dehydrogenase [Bacteriovoracaceae bacterium]